MATGVEELLDMLYELIDEAKSVPLSSEKCIIERDKALDLLDDIKAQFPMELNEAKKLIAARAAQVGQRLLRGRPPPHRGGHRRGLRGAEGQPEQVPGCQRRRQRRGSASLLRRGRGERVTTNFSKKAHPNR